VSFDLDLIDRRALVTGGTKGVGAAVVEVLRDAGANVITTARSMPADAIQGVHYIVADLATAGDVLPWPSSFCSSSVGSTS
jgi:NAD(P)-dependent dehydrogenase (short-subunit alcohol dehydrogenase family)